jgi:hypothetical protein
MARQTKANREAAGAKAAATRKKKAAKRSAAGRKAATTRKAHETEREHAREYLRESVGETAHAITDKAKSAAVSAGKAAKTAVEGAKSS